ncbi:winged helix DNA-binding domain-containing protein [candidate division KSB1 bacterium]|nr:winged helix DNA-binding domain-containing protein [candidate division KSB1 bacterium]
MRLTWDDIENLRDRTFHRTPELQLKDIDDAERFVNETGFCFAFKMQKSELPCMWHAATGERHPRYPLHVQHDPYIGLVWTAKDALAAAKRVYYGKALKKRPTFISLEFFPSFYWLQKRKNGQDYVGDYLSGRLSQEARRIMEALMERSPLVTLDLKMACGMAHPHKRAAFDRAMAELQSKMYIVKIAEFYDPFTFLWELLDRRFASEISAAAKLSSDAAREKIVVRYFKNLWVSEPASMGRLFGWERPDIGKTLASLLEKGIITENVEIEGEKQRFFAISSLLQNLKMNG